jgi:hypothetical protein
MTKENREKAYLHFRDLEKNYLAPPHLNHGLTSTSSVKARAKKNADNLLAKRPELAELEKPKKEEKKPEPKAEEKEEKPTPPKPKPDSKKKEKK